MPTISHRLWRAAMTPLFVLALSAVPAGAQVVIDGGAPNSGAGWDIFDDRRAATVFSTASTVSFTDIRFWGILPDIMGAYTPTIYWEILNDAGGTPGTTAASGNGLSTSLLRTSIIPGFSSWQFDVGTGAQTLGAGVYWLALHDGPLDPSSFTGSTLIWETTDLGTYADQTFTIDDHWDVIPGNGLAFQLRDAPVVGTPEPATLTLASTGLLLLAGFLRRRRR